jgi:hypothetical protein
MKAYGLVVKSNHANNQDVTIEKSIFVWSFFTTSSYINLEDQAAIRKRIPSLSKKKRTNNEIRPSQ